MKRIVRSLLLAIGLVTLFSPPPVSFADELPLEKSSSGTFSVEYANQHFRISSTVAVKVRFEQLAPDLVKLTFYSESSAAGKVSVYWVEQSKTIYSGPVPTSFEPWEGTLNTEGGFVDR
ncbi:MAG TPA: hypothetical protein VF247_02900 [Candidatus Krumholzibacteria bacterium]